MASPNDRRRILDMLAAGKVTADQAAALLKALGPTPAESLPLPPAPHAPERPRFPSGPRPTPDGPGRRRPRFVRIKVDAAKPGGSSTNVDVHVPYALAKFALRFLPQEARRELEVQGIDVAELLDAADGELPEGKLVDIDSADVGGESTQITVEVL